MEEDRKRQEEQEFSDEPDEDLNEARGLEDTGIVDFAITSQLTKLFPETIFPTASQCLEKDISTGLIRPDSIDRPIAPRYSSANQRFGFIYTFAHVDFDEAVKCSKEEMIQACKDFPLANWDKWSFYPKEYFLKWMMTEMGATMSRIHKDPIQPCPGLGDGYNIWLKWNPEANAFKTAKIQVAKEISEQDKKALERVKAEGGAKNLPEFSSTPLPWSQTAGRKRATEMRLPTGRQISPKAISKKRPIENNIIIVASEVAVAADSLDTRTK